MEKNEKPLPVRGPKVKNNGAFPEEKNYLS